MAELVRVEAFEPDLPAPPAEDLGDAGLDDACELADLQPFLVSTRMASADPAVAVDGLDGPAAER